MISFDQILNYLLLKYFLHIAYKGSNYRGWQRQVNVLSVQQVLEEKLAAVLKQETTILGCGRTDAQVHASQYFLQFETIRTPDDDFVFVLNKVLPTDIRVYDLFEVDDKAQVQLDAKKRTYRYYFHNQENPFINQLSAYYPFAFFDKKSVNQCLELLTQYKNYRAFCKTPDRHNHTLVQVISAKIKSNKANTNFCIEITANRFLKGMMRSLVHALLDVGLGITTAIQFEERLASAAAVENIQLAYPQGLYLSEVKYDYLEVKRRVESVSVLLKM